MLAQRRRHVVRGIAVGVSGAVLLAIVVVQLSGSEPAADADALLARARGGAKLKIAAPPRYDQGKTGDFLNSLKVLGSGGKNAALFDTSPQDLDGLPAQEITKIHQKEEAARRKAEEAATAKAAAAKAPAIKAHKPSLAEIKLDRAAAKEGDKLLAEDRKTAAEELSSPEKAVHKMMSQDLPLVKARQAAFQANVKKMAFADKVLEERRREYEAAQAKKVKGFVSSQDAAYEKTLAAAVKRETAGHNEYNTIYSSMENQVDARDKAFMQRVFDARIHACTFHAQTQNPKH